LEKEKKSKEEICYETLCRKKKVGIIKITKVWMNEISIYWMNFRKKYW
jgi:hypothetical protein